LDGIGLIRFNPIVVLLRRHNEPNRRSSMAGIPVGRIRTALNIESVAQCVAATTGHRAASIVEFVTHSRTSTHKTARKIFRLANQQPHIR